MKEVVLGRIKLIGQNSASARVTKGPHTRRTGSHAGTNMVHGCPVDSHTYCVHSIWIHTLRVVARYPCISQREHTSYMRMASMSAGVGAELSADCSRLPAAVSDHGRAVQKKQAPQAAGV